MIVTITLNPSIDTVYFIDKFKIDGINRVQAPIKAAGGKGINCARAAASMGAEVLATGLVAGPAGDWMMEDIRKSGLFQEDMEKIPGESRTSLTIMHDAGKQTEIIEAGPEVELANVIRMLDRLKKYVHKISVICISGSVNTKQDDLYSEALKYIHEHLSDTLPVFVDTSGVQLSCVMESEQYFPVFIKPNEEEFAALTGLEVGSKAAALNALAKSTAFTKMPDLNIMVSFGGKGAACKIDKRYFDVTIPKIEIINTTGSGDSTLAGMAYAYEKNLDTLDKIKYAMAFGMSNAQQAEIGKVIPADVENFVKQIQVEEVFV
jgi:tagatose 6-phosphate kinase